MVQARDVRFQGARLMGLVAMLVVVLAATDARPSAAGWVDAGAVRTVMGSAQARDLYPVSAAAGDGFTVLLASDGALYAAGRNDIGQLGDGTATGRVTPVQVELPTGTVVEAFDVGIDHTVVLDGAGQVWTWGGGHRTPVTVAVGASAPLVAVDTGGYCTFALAQDGSVYSWGNNGGGRLGRSALGTGNSAQPYAPDQVDATGPGFVAVGVTGGRSGGAAWDTDGAVRVWGTNAWGGASGVSITFDPAVSPAPTGVVQATLTATDLLVLDDIGRVWAVQAGQGTTATLLPETQGHTVSQVITSYAAGSLVDPTLDIGTFFITDGGGLYAFGDNTYGQLGLDPAVPYYAVATAVPVPEAPVSVVAGDRHTVLTSASETFYAAGDNSYGQFATGSTSSEPTTPFAAVSLVCWYWDAP